MKHGKGKFKASTIMTLCTLVTFVLVVLGIGPSTVSEITRI